MRSCQIHDHIPKWTVQRRLEGNNRNSTALSIFRDTCLQYTPQVRITTFGIRSLFLWCFPRNIRNYKKFDPWVKLYLDPPIHTYSISFLRDSKFVLFINPITLPTQPQRHSVEYPCPPPSPSPVHFLFHPLPPSPFPPSNSPPPPARILSSAYTSDRQLTVTVTPLSQFLPNKVSSHSLPYKLMFPPLFAFTIFGPYCVPQLFLPWFTLCMIYFFVQLNHNQISLPYLILTSDPHPHSRIDVNLFIND